MMPLQCGVSENRLQWSGGHHSHKGKIIRITSIFRPLVFFSHLFEILGCSGDTVSPFLWCPRLYESFCLGVILPSPSPGKHSLKFNSSTLIVFPVQQIMRLSPHSLDTGPSFRGRLMEVKSALTRCMKRESVNHFLYVQCIGKSIIYNQPFSSKDKSSSFICCLQHVKEVYCKSIFK